MRVGAASRSHDRGGVFIEAGPARPESNTAVRYLL